MKRLIFITYIFTLIFLFLGCSPSNPTENEILEAAKKSLINSEDSEDFIIKDVKILNTYQEGTVFSVKIDYKVTPKYTHKHTMIRTGSKHILPIGFFQSGKIYSGQFKLIMKKYDKGWEIDGYQRY